MICRLRQIDSFSEHLHLSPNLRHAFDTASERGASCWLTTLPIAEHGSKWEFKIWLATCEPASKCVCGKSVSVEHAFTCLCGRFPSICHNEVRDLTASLLSEVCCDVGVEPTLQRLDCEHLHYATANREDGARLDVDARDFWGGNRQCAFFDIKVFNPFARSYSCLPLPRCYQVHEQEK